MSERLKELHYKIVEAQDVLDFLVKYQIPISYGGYNFLFNELRSLRLEFAELENIERKNNHRMITCN